MLFERKNLNFSESELINILEKIFDSIAFIIAYSITALLFKSAKFLYLSLTLPMRAGIIQEILGDIFFTQVELFFKLF